MMDEMLVALRNIQTNNKVILGPSFPFIGAYKQDGVDFCGQDCSAYESGARTGEVSAKMLADFGAKYVIVGHSERRQYHNETNEIVKQKALRATAAGLTPIICVGETRDERDSGTAFSVIEKQFLESTDGLATYIIAYEPVWAIGTGLTPTLEQITEVHNALRKLTPAKLLYGGSAKASNATDIMSIPNVDGVLVGGASLDSNDFIPIINAV